MTNFILGTAGHIDHGKTALIKALTGIDCDTHPEEKLRGITINLGFSHLDLNDGNSIGIVDVPGHHDFINTMVAGAHGIDIFMLVIAADNGIMPQTIEHLQIAQTLGIKQGFVALTKIDLVDEEFLLMIENEIKEFLKKTFLSGCKILRVSSTTGQGIEQLKDHLSEVIANSRPKSSSQIFRMYIDRIFSVSGFGTVVTGSVIDGMINKSESVYLLPTNKELRIRRMERHGNEVGQISSGNRVSINLVGLNKEDFSRGMLLSDRIIKPSKLIDAKLDIFSANEKIKTWSDVIFLSGTFMNQAKMHILDSVESAEAAFAQFHLSEPCVVLRGDKFVVRSTSGIQTLGGGVVIDPYPLHHRRKSVKLVSQLKKISNGNSNEIIFSEVRKRRTPLTLNELTDELNILTDKIHQQTLNLLPADISAIHFEKDIIFILDTTKDKIKSAIIKSIDICHKKNPLIETGRTFEELVGLVEVESNKISEPILNSMLNELISEKKIKKVENTWSLINHSVQLNQNEQRNIDFIDDYFKQLKMQTPLISDLIKLVSKEGIDEKKLNQILNMLTSQNILYRIDNGYLHSSVVEDSRKKILKYLNSNPDGITVAGFRDLVKGNRKICLLMLSLFDGEEIIFRESDVRKITDKGKEYLLDNG